MAENPSTQSNLFAILLNDNALINRTFYLFYEDLHKILFKCGLQTYIRHLVLKTYNLEF